MTLLKLQHIMSNEIGKRSFLSRPPEPPAGVLLSDPFESIYVGTTKIFKVPFTWSYMNLTNPHISVVGITGSGKSYFVKTLLIRASYVWNTNAVIIDWAGEYKAWVKQTGGIVVSLAKGDYLNIMDLSGMKPLDRSKQIMNSFDILTDIALYPEQKRITEEALEQAYLNAGFIPSERAPEGKDAPTLKEVISLLQEKLQEGTYEYPAELENAIYRLRQFAREGEDYFSRKSTLDIGKLAQSGLVSIDLSSLPDEKFRALAALFILQTLKEKMRSEGFTDIKGLKAIVVLDEAWKVASDEKSDAIMIVREGRKYQFGLIVASQNPTDINEAIFSNVGTSFILRIKFEKFMNYLQGSLNFSNFIRSEISKFGVGQAAVEMAFQTALRFPETFLLEKIQGEEPLYVYTLDMSDVLTQSELSANVLQRDYQFEKDELKNKFIEYNMSSDGIDEIFSMMNSQSRNMKMLDLVKELKKSGISIANIVAFLKSLSIDDPLITRIISSSGIENAQV
ncbi:MAG TPA: ATP-binding protein [Candidatus Baltobacteraceae bacterium]|nr:ATP-binding protein [Candidatus Baltobacteraceae bacterium]